MYGKSVKADSYMSRTYQIKTELGSGGNGAVYMAWHKRLRKHVVIKVVKNCLDGTIEIRRNEVEALKNIKSMHIPQVLDFLTGNDHSFTIMEYIEGISFDKLIKIGLRFTELRIIKWYCQMASALDSIHKLDICHRDIKPANIILTPKGDVCLIDFNSALVAGNTTRLISRSMGYASPEQYEYFKLCRKAFEDAGNASVDYIETALLPGDCRTIPIPEERHLCPHSADQINWQLSDIYSLGATMFHFLTGKYPPVRMHEIECISKLEGYTKGLLEIIERSMSEKPSDRFSSAETLVKALQTIH